LSETLVGLLQTAGENGLKLREAIEIAEREGKHQTVVRFPRCSTGRNALA
jgi:hypothetical protein